MKSLLEFRSIVMCVCVFVLFFLKQWRKENNLTSFSKMEFQFMRKAFWCVGEYVCGRCCCYLSKKHTSKHTHARARICSNTFKHSKTKKIKIKNVIYSVCSVATAAVVRLAPPIAKKIKQKTECIFNGNGKPCSVSLTSNKIWRISFSVAIAPE